jgi:hypothetical protein
MRVPALLKLAFNFTRIYPYFFFIPESISFQITRLKPCCIQTRISSAPMLFLSLLLVGFAVKNNAETLKMEPVVQLKQGTLEGFRFR